MNIYPCNETLYDEWEETMIAWNSIYNNIQKYDKMSLKKTIIYNLKFVFFYLLENDNVFFLLFYYYY